MQKVLVVSDIHGPFEDLQRRTQEQQPDVVLQCGDFGWITPFTKKKLNFGATTVYWCEGNHDNHPELQKLRQRTGSPQAHELAPGIFYQDRGSVMELEDGRTVLFV